MEKKEPKFQNKCKILKDKSINAATGSKEVCLHFTVAIPAPDHIESMDSLIETP